MTKDQRFGVVLGVVLIAIIALSAAVPRLIIVILAFAILIGIVQGFIWLIEWADRGK